MFVQNPTSSLGEMSFKSIVDGQRLITNYVAGELKNSYLGACMEQDLTMLYNAGFIQASLSKIQGLLKDFPTVFKDLKLKKNTDLHVKILLWKC